MGSGQLVWLGLMDISMTKKLGRNVRVDIPKIKKKLKDIGDKEDE